MSGPTLHRTAPVDVSCDTCGRLVHLTAQPSQWTFSRGQWHVAEWGPATGECCETLHIAAGVPAVPPQRPPRARLPDYLDEDDDLTGVTLIPFTPPQEAA